MDVKRSVLQFKVTLDEVNPLVWRRIEVPASYSFWDFHVAVQDAMGWFDSHLHLFRLPNPESGEIDEIGIPDEDVFEGDPVCLPGWQVQIAPYFGKIGASAVYEYDFGDDWIHEVQLEAITGRQPRVKYPRCLDGERACPPEDCGGPPGYARLLEIIADPTDEEYESMMEWLGGSFDPEAFSPREVNFDNPKKRWRIAFGSQDADHDPTSG
ncbi:MAG: plasmid pRiA4b ORF-3 family protein [Gemmatimonadales bacterium]|nr:plasmid pRiA4b ORF-3 family protein [Gemmatimonadales bacterium]